MVEDYIANMTKDNFYNWIKGFADLNESTPTKEQWDLIKKHIKLVEDMEKTSYRLVYKPYDENTTLELVNKECFTC